MMSRRMSAHLPALQLVLQRLGEDGLADDAMRLLATFKRIFAALRDGASPRAPAGGNVGQVAAATTMLAANELFTASQVVALLDERNRRGTAPTAATTPTPAANASMVTAPTLVQSMNDWLRASQQTWATKTALEYTTIVREFVQWAEQRDVRRVAEVSRAHARDYRTWLLEDRELVPATVQKRLMVLAAYFRDAQAQGEYPPGPLPTYKLKFSKTMIAQQTESYEVLTGADLKTIFEPVRYRKWARQPDYFWPALIMLHHGLRVSEACQLVVADFGELNGRPTLRIEETLEGQHVKTAATVRVVPLHPRLVDLGLLDYVADVRRIAGEGLLFPYLRANSVNGYADASGEALNKRLKKHFGAVRKRGHSFRHTVVETLKQAGVGEEARCEYVGHTHNTINSTVYARKLNLPKLAELVFPHLTFPLDYAALRYRPREFDARIRRRLQLREQEARHAEAKKGRVVA